MTGINKIRFEVEISRILEVLSSEIYDSPYALLRENIQNAYDAILIRGVEEGNNWATENGEIQVLINKDEIVIEDNGIGMNEEVLRNNYWKAGSSGKRNELAYKAGVIGTFGIGAMANFGVCKKLSVETRSTTSPYTYLSTVERDKLSLTEECIDLIKIEDTRSSGTKIIATLDSNSPITLQGSIEYLNQYTKYLPVKLIVNGTLISKNDYKQELLNDQSLHYCDNILFDKHGFSGNIQVVLDGRGNSIVEVNNITLNAKPVTGEMYLVQNKGYINGLRSYFGLAPIPISLVYKLGGIVNLSFLQPTAGREALSRESIEYVNIIINIIEEIISEQISKTNFADKNSEFITYIANHQRVDLASKITIRLEPDSTDMELGNLSNLVNKELYYYTGQDKNIIQQFATELNNLIIVSQINARRKIQLQYISQLNIKAVPDQATILKTYLDSELTYPEMALILRLNSVLRNDYLIMDLLILYADISHGVTCLVNKENEKVIICFARNSSIITPVTQCYETAPEIFDGFVKDFIRVHLFSRISNFVPSSQRQGAAALQRILRQKRELFSYEKEDFGKFESLIGDYIEGKISLDEVFKTSVLINQSNSEVVTKNNIGQVEQEIPDIVNSPVRSENQNINTQPANNFEPTPAILRLDTETAMKILTVQTNMPQLNNFKMFLALSDNLFHSDREFFLAAHSTKIIWGSHRIVFIFVHISGSLTLYYDIELREPIEGTSVGGDMIPTTTIITKSRIFIPIPEILIPTFQIKEETKKFYVRYELL